MLSFLKTCIVFILTAEARLVLLRHAPKVIAVTGSVGKTTTKDAIFAALSGEMHVRKSMKSFNSELGVPLTILGLDSAWSDPIGWLWNMVRGLWVIVSPEPYPAWLVLEVGADRPGDIRSVARWLRPDIAVLTGVPDIPVHVEYFSSPDEVFKEKRAIADYLRSGGKLVINGDDTRSRELLLTHRGACVTYGMDEKNDFSASHDEIEYEGTTPVGVRFRANHAGYSVPVAVYGALGRPRVYAALAAIAVGDCVGLDSVTTARALTSWDPPPGRVRIVAGLNGSLLIDDTYNSSPTAALAALDLLGEVKGKRKIAILGDMLELGKYSKEAHRQVGERAAAVADRLATVGFRSRAIGEAARGAGMRDDNIKEYELGESLRAGEDLAHELKPGDIVLVKGSQGMRMERTVHALMAEPKSAKDLLVRMDAEWLNR